MRSLRIKNFKCFNDKTVNFRNLTVLAGGNGAGKSTVIQSILLFAQNINRSNLDNLPKILNLNNYFCNLGSSNRLEHHSSNSEIFEFEFRDKNMNSVHFYLSKDSNDTNILNIIDVFDLKQKDSKYGALSFLEYFDFIGADRFGPKSFHQIDSNFSRISVGKMGEYTGLILNNNKLKSLEKINGRLLSNVNTYLSEIFGDIQVDTIFNEEAGIAILKIKNHKNGEYENPVSMPYGISYLLPIIVSCLVRLISKNELFENYASHEDENEVVIIENPEAHLHPSAQSKLGYFLAKMSNHIQIIIETHSEHIINGIRLATLENDINKNEILINFFNSNEDNLEPNIKEILIDKFSDLTDWPRGFFDQQAMDIGKIYQERAKRNAKN